ncbi:MAG: glycosyltransferase [Deferrisomatales bacterium]
MNERASSTEGTNPGALRVLHLAHARWLNAEVQYALDLAEEMARRGHRPVVLGQGGAPGVREARSRGLPAEEEAGLGAKGLRAVAALGAAGRLLGRLRREAFDAVEVHRPEAFPLIAWACRRAGVPVVRVRGDMRPVRADPLNRWVHRRLVAAVVASNTAVEASLRRRLGPLPRLTTIHGGVDPGVFRPGPDGADVRAELGAPARGVLVGILGRLGRVKGHEDFLEAARRVLREGVEAAFAVLVKEPTEQERVLRARVAQDPVLGGRVGFLGHREDLPAVLRAFDLGVVASTGSEANCRVGLEWMASGVPLLATRVGVLPDLVEDGRSGALVPPGDPAALAEALAGLARRPGALKAMGRESRRRVVERFSLARCARAHEELIRGVAARFRADESRRRGARRDGAPGDEGLGAPPEGRFFRGASGDPGRTGAGGKPLSFGSGSW